MRKSVVSVEMDEGGKTKVVATKYDPVVPLKDGEDVVSPLTTEQAEDYLSELESLVKDRTEEELRESVRIEKLKMLTRKLVVNGLNNAHVAKWVDGVPEYEPGFARWTADRVRREIDLVFLDALRSVIFSLSGLRSATEGEAAPVS